MFQILYRFFALGLDVIPAVILIVPIMLITQHVLFNPMSIGRKLLMIIFGIYLSGVFLVVGIPSLTTIRIDLVFNLIPLIDIVSDPIAYTVNTLLNILLFMPLGFLMPAIWEEYRSMKKIVLFGFGMSVLIETMQMFTYRLTDIDDLIFNTIGAAVGYYIYILFLKYISEKEKAELKAVGETSVNRLELPIVFTTVFLIMFLVQPVISSALWTVVLK